MDLNQQYGLRRVINACGKLIAELITAKQTQTLDISCLTYSRFEEGQLIREYKVI